MIWLPTFEDHSRAYLPGVSRQDVWGGLGWRDAYDDLWPGHSKPKQKGSDCRFDSQKEAEEYADGVLRMFAALPDPVEVFRAVQSDGPPGVDEPGESWSFRREAALAFGGHNGSNWMFTAKVARRDVDWKATVDAYVKFSGNGEHDDEDEIVVRDSSKLRDIAVAPLKKKQR